METLVPFESDNLEGYRLLLRIEIVVREVLREVLHAHHGAHWRRQLPRDLREKIHRDESDESRRGQFDFVRLGPLYYLTFGELLTLLNQGAPAFVKARAELGGTLVLASLQAAMSPRNAIAHSRGVSSAGLLQVRALYAQMEAFLTHPRLQVLLKSPDVGVRPEEIRPALADWFQRTAERMRLLQGPCPTEAKYLLGEEQYWWDLPEVARFDTTLVEQAAGLVKAYNGLPAGLGAAASRQRFLEERGAIAILGQAVGALTGRP